jgi:hypothetical protein
MAVMAVVMEPMRRFKMANAVFDGGEDPQDWVPEIESEPLTIDEIDDKWIQFYADRIQTQIENFLEQN